MALLKCKSKSGRHSWDWTNHGQGCYVCGKLRKELYAPQDHLVGERVLAHLGGKEATIVEALNPGWVRILYTDNTLAIYPYRKLIRLSSAASRSAYEELFI